MISLLPRPQAIMLTVILLLTFLTAPNIIDGTRDKEALASIEEPYNVILMIGDGMAPAQIELARLVEYGSDGNFTMQQAPRFLSVTTFSADNSITDSAAAATAIATGWKTNNGMLSVLPNGTILETILEGAQLNGKATGLVATSYIQHATPAAFATHVLSRNNIAEISRQFVEESEVDILMGGGLDYFSTQQLQDMANQNYTVVQNRTELFNVQAGKVLGLFSGGHMDYEAVRNYAMTPSLAEMTNKSLEILSQDPDGFFLMVEGSRIDHAAHSNDAIGVALETIAFDESVKVALEYVQNHNNTILVITADHETGGLAIVSHNLSDELPNEDMTEEERRALRIERAQNITVTWSTSSHTATNVSLFCFGPLFDGLPNGSLIDNTDIFDEISSFYEGELSEPVLTSTETTTTTTNESSTTTTTSTTETSPNTSTETTSISTTESPSSVEDSTYPDTPPGPFILPPIYLGISLGVMLAIIVVIVIVKQSK